MKNESVRCVTWALNEIPNSVHSRAGTGDQILVSAIQRRTWIPELELGQKRGSVTSGTLWFSITVNPGDFLYSYVRSIYISTWGGGRWELKGSALHTVKPDTAVCFPLSPSRLSPKRLSRTLWTGCGRCHTMPRKHCGQPPEHLWNHSSVHH